MRKLAVILLSCLFIPAIKAQTSQALADSIALYFNQVKAATEKHARVWDKNLYGPILIVDTVTRTVYANQPGSGNLLTPIKDIFTGTLPRQIGLSNTSLEWDGITWAMVKLPLSANRNDRTDLIVHELFHSTQSSLGFVIRNADNEHLNRKDGRIYLLLEIVALESALRSARLRRAEEHIRNALVFRKYRHLVYRGAQVMENRLEMHEGLATYTGQIMSGRDKWQWREHLTDRLHRFKNLPTFVRSFAYETVPVYGFFLYQKNNGWIKDITPDTDLTDYFFDAFGLDMRIVLPTYVQQLAEEYQGKAIEEKEMKRQDITSEQLDAYRDKFFENKRLEIKLSDKMNISFDIQNVIPLDADEGTVYPSLHLSDDWGILTVEHSGALLSPGRQWAVVSEPVIISETEIKGDGWTLELNDGYIIEENKQGNYLVSKKQ